MTLGIHQCEQPPPLKTRWPLGIDLITDVFRAANADHILEFFCKIIEQNGITFEQNLLGSRGIDTVDPRNIEAILSSQFKGDKISGLRSSSAKGFQDKQIS